MSVLEGTWVKLTGVWAWTVSQRPSCRSPQFLPKRVFEPRVRGWALVAGPQSHLLSWKLGGCEKAVVGIAAHWNTRPAALGLPRLKVSQRPTCRWLTNPLEDLLVGNKVDVAVSL